MQAWLFEMANWTNQALPRLILVSSNTRNSNWIWDKTI